MKKRAARILGCLMAATLAFTSLGVPAYADTISPAEDLISEDLISEDVISDDVTGIDEIETVSAEDELSVDDTQVIPADEEVSIDEAVLSEDTLGGLDGLSAPSDEVIDNGYNADKAEDVKLPTIYTDYLRPGADKNSVGYNVNYVEYLSESDAYSTILWYKVGDKYYYSLFIWGNKNGTTIIDSVGSYLTDELKEQITDIIVADSIKNIAISYLFSDFTGVSHVYLSSNLESLKQHDFYNCTSLKEITIPGSLKSSQGYTFHNCSSLETVTFANGITTIPDNFMRADTGGDSCSVKTVVFPSSLKMIGTQAFMDMYYLENVTFSNPTATRLTYIGPQAFYNTNLSSLSLPKFAGTWVDENYVTPKQKNPTIESLAFGSIRNTDFKELRIPEGVKVLKQIYDANSHFVDIYLPTGFETSGLQNAFLRNPNAELKNIYFAGTQKEFEDAFGNNYVFKIDYGPWTKLVRFGKTPAKLPPVDAITTEDVTSYVEYYDDMSSSETKDLTLNISPVKHEDTVFTVSSSNPSVASGELGGETDGTLPLTLKIYRTLGNATVTVKGGNAKLEINVSVKGMDQAEKPRVIGNGTNAGDAYTLLAGTSDAQVFYVINGSGSSYGLSNSSYYNYNDTTGKYTSSSIKEYTDPIIVGEDTTPSAYYLHAVTVKKGLTVSDELTVELPCTQEDPWGSLTDEDKATIPSASDIPEGLWVPGSQLTGLIYTGKAVTVDGLRVYYGNKLLTERKDYTLLYRNNTNAAPHTAATAPYVEVRLMGDYSGTQQMKFTIAPQTVDTSKLEYTVTNVKARLVFGSPSEQTPDLRVKLGTKMLRKGVDYDIHFKSTGEYANSVREPGSYEAHITLKGNYTGTLDIPNAVTVLGGTDVGMDTAQVSFIKPQNITDWADKGYTVEPAFEVKYKNKVVPDDLYDARFVNNTAAGTGYLILTGKGTSSTEFDTAFHGTKTVSFRINGIGLTMMNLTTNLKSSYTYTGKPIDPSEADDFEVKYNGKSLVKGKDYTVDFIAAHTKAGVVTMNITGAGIYSGKVMSRFNIAKTQLDSSSVRFLNADGAEWDETNITFPYTQNGVTPAFKVYDTNTKQYLTSADYTVRFLYNRGVASYNDFWAPSIMLTGRGNYAGTYTANFSIEQSDIGRLNMELDDLVFVNSPGRYTRRITIKDTNGVALKQMTDYNRDLTYTYDSDAVVEKKEMVNRKMVNKTYNRKKGDPVDKADVIKPGAVIRVTATGVNNYKGTLSNTFTVAAKSINDLRFTLTKSEYEYTGREIRPAKSNVKVELKTGYGWTTLSSDEAGSYFDITGYNRNISKGAATMTIKAKNGYAGSKTLNFRIAVKKN
ncbi:MAG: leucine-rich repeat domain-containing protein [Lachnospiraceae bacterium]|nr:leucine-rich repeat domain-containing protein [Lachnospiraceae bacterium]